MYPFSSNGPFTGTGPTIAQVRAGAVPLSSPTVAAAPAWIGDSSGLTIYQNGKSYTIPKSHVNYEKILDALRNKQYEQLEKLMDVSVALNEFAHGAVEVVNGEVLYMGNPMHNVMADRMIEMMKQGFDVKPLANFMENLMQNPSRTAVSELYLFLESGKLPITEDGCFLAYKKVKDNFYDIYSGKFDHSPGKVLEMPRNEVDDNRDRTCSYGFHFCSIAYLPQFGNSTGNRVVIVKINPKDVVSIPSDYNNTKGRTCRYEVVGEYTGAWDRGTEAWDTPVADEYDGWDYYAPVQRPTRMVPPVQNAVGYGKPLPLRDPETGRFVKTGSQRWYDLKDLGY